MSLYHFIEKNSNWEEGCVKEIEHVDSGFFICPSYHKTFYEQIPGIGRYQCRSHAFIHKILYASSKLMSFKTVAETNGISVSIVIRYFDRLTFQRPLHLPAVLSLDEFRGNACGQRYL